MEDSVATVLLRTRQQYLYVEGEEERCEKEGLQCPVCMSPFQEPMMHLSCCQLFCSACLSSLAACPLCRAAVASRTTDVLPRLITNKLDALKIRCKECDEVLERRELAKHQEENCPSLLRLNDVERRRRRLHLLPPPERIRLIQSHHVADRVPMAYGDNVHLWSLSLEAAVAPLVRKVVWYLHPTFLPRVVNASLPPFTLQRTGWGTFTVRCDVHLGENVDCEQKVIKGAHDLMFEGTGDCVCWTDIPL